MTMNEAFSVFTAYLTRHWQTFRADRERVLVSGSLLVLSGVWIVLGETWLNVGPAHVDDFRYMELAARGDQDPGVINRYFHIWGLRFFGELFGTRFGGAIAYGIAVQLGLIWSTYFISRRFSPPLMSLLAACVVPLLAPLLMQFTVPLPDPPTTMWSCAALAVALTAHFSRRAAAFAWIVCGMFVFISVKTKETGVAVVPALILLWYHQPVRRRVLLWALGGGLAGWLLLSVCDALYGGDFWFSWKLTSYKALGGSWLSLKWASAETKEVAENTSKAISENVFTALSRIELIPLAAMGIAGIITGFRTNIVVRALAVWCLSAVIIQSLLFSRYGGLHALQRYMPSIIVPLGIAAVYWVYEVWQNARRSNQRSPIGAWLLMGFVTLVPAYAHFARHSGSNLLGRMDFFLLPVAIILLALAPSLANGCWLRRLSASALLVFLLVLNTETGLGKLHALRERGYSFRSIAAAIDDLPVRTVYVVTRIKKHRLHSPRRYALCLRAFSRRPVNSIRHAQRKSLRKKKRTHVMFVPADEADSHEQLGWQRLGAGEYRGRKFVALYRLGRQVGKRRRL